jgi:hypothetical protein
MKTTKVTHKTPLVLASEELERAYSALRYAKQAQALADLEVNDCDKALFEASMRLDREKADYLRKG